MRQFAAFSSAVLAVFLLAACGPATITPDRQSAELVTPLPFEEAFSVAVNTINTQSYPADTNGWVITESDQVGGFVAAQLNGNRCGFLQGCRPFSASVSVAFVERAGGTAVNISRTRQGEADDLADRIAERLGVSGG